MKVQFIEKSFHAKSMKTIEVCNAIIADYAEQGFTLTLRQLYYQLVTINHFPNTMRSYKNLSALLTDAREAGLVDWDAIEDSGRERKSWGKTRDLYDCATRLKYHVHKDYWEDQDYNVEVWVEKDALSNVIEKACTPLRVPYVACKGYMSASEMFAAAQRMANFARQGKPTVVIHLGDHDPSGIDMTGDIKKRLHLYSNNADIEVQRIALNMDQIEQYNPPPNPAKVTDSRAAAYIERFGTNSWELDALQPAVIVSLIRKHLSVYVNRDDLNDGIEWENDQVERCDSMLRNWDEIETIINRG